MLKKITALILSFMLMQPVFANLGGLNSDSGGTSQTSASSSDTNVTTTIVVIGAVILSIGIPLSIVSTTVKGQQSSAKRIVYFMKNNHNELIHDVSHGSGVLLSQIAFELGLTKSELMQIEKRLAGSTEQKYIIETLDGEIDTDDALKFSKNLSNVFLDALGETRITQVMKNAWGIKQ